MRYLFIVAIAVFCNIPMKQITFSNETTRLSPLAAYSGEWNNPKYSICNTAEKVIYMNDKEREVIYILNLARTWPKLFANTVLSRYPSLSGNDHLVNNEYYYQTLIKTMLTMNPAPLLYANEKCYKSAECHAKYSGNAGTTGHIRKSADCKAKQQFSGECCDYGNAEPVDIVLSLLIDENVPSLGHRNILLGYYSGVGVSIQPHLTYRQNTVLDFDY